MLLKKLLPAAVLLLSTIPVGCEKKEAKNENFPTPIADRLPLNSVSDLFGSWKHCNEIGENRSSYGLYDFGVDGALAVEYKTFPSLDCSGEAISNMALKGTYTVGEGNALDLSLNWGEKAETVYRVFKVEGTKLSISNSLGLSGSSANRDTNISVDPLVLTKI